VRTRHTFANTEAIVEADSVVWRSAAKRTIVVAGAGGKVAELK